MGLAFRRPKAENRSGELITPVHLKSDVQEMLRTTSISSDASKIRVSSGDGFNRPGEKIEVPEPSSI